MTNPDSPLLEGGRSKDTAVLGVSCFGHDASAALVRASDGVVLHAVAEERLTNRKHDSHLPVGAIARCQDAARRAGLAVTDVAVSVLPEAFLGTLEAELAGMVPDAVAVTEAMAAIARLVPVGDYFDPGRESFASRALSRIVARLGLGEPQREAFARRLTWYFNWAVKYRAMLDVLGRAMGGLPVHAMAHHRAHAASALHGSGFARATVLVVDGQGESETVSVYLGEAGRLSLVSRTAWPHSLGIFYLFATEHLGFGLGDEYKVMGMSALGKPTLLEGLRETMHVDDAGVLHLLETPWLERREHGHDVGHLVFRFTKAFQDVLPRRRKDQPLGQAHFDFAASVQRLTEEIGDKLAERAIARTGCKDLALAGGVGLNGLMNERIRRSGACDRLFVFPAAGDDGTSVGAAQDVVFGRLGRNGPRVSSVAWGAADDDARIEAALRDKGLAYTAPRELHETIAAALVDGKIVARFTGRAEFGPRALGHRSILANPCDPRTKDVLNVRIKHREEFRPFAPACLAERAAEYFDIDVDAPFMLLITTARELARQKIPAVVHGDGTARVQTVRREDSPDFHGIIAAFDRRTGVPVVVNTSFNVNGEAIVDTAVDAIESFGFMDIDFLAIGPFWVSKEENAARFPALAHDDYLAIRKARFAAEGHLLADLDIVDFPEPFFRASVPWRPSR